jgi:hypothetical protein
MADTISIQLPGDVVEAAGLRPADQIAWRFEAGEIRGRKMRSQTRRRITGKLIRRGGLLLLDTTGLAIDEPAIARAVREERDR